METNANEIAAILASMPNSPENQPAIEALIRIANESRVIRQPYFFEVDFSTIGGVNGMFAAPAAGAQVVGNFLVDSSAPFMLVSAAYRSDLAAAAQTNGALITPNATVFITDQSGNRNWMNSPVPVTNIFGTAQQPYFYPQPRLIPANTNIQVTLANYDAASAPNTRLTFHGFRLYAIGQ